VPAAPLDRPDPTVDRCVDRDQGRAACGGHAPDCPGLSPSQNAGGCQDWQDVDLCVVIGGKCACCVLSIVWCVRCVMLCVFCNILDVHFGMCIVCDESRYFACLDTAFSAFIFHA